MIFTTYSFAVNDEKEGADIGSKVQNIIKGLIDKAKNNDDKKEDGDSKEKENKKNDDGEKNDIGGLNESLSKLLK